MIGIKNNLNSILPIFNNKSIYSYSNGKDIKFGVDCRSRMLKGAEKLCKGVSATLGPKGRNVCIDQAWGVPKITKDGVTVAKNIEFEDKFENLGAQMVRQVASKTNDDAGDGTTTATVLTTSIFTEGCKSVASGLNPMEILKGINQAVRVVKNEIESQSKKCETTEEISQVATISANGDKNIGGLIASAIEKVGKEGVITVEEGKTFDNQLEVVKGLKFERGFISPYFITDTQSMKCEYEKPVILITDKKISNMNEIIPSLKIAVSQNSPLLIIAEDIEGEALGTLVINRIRGGAKVCAVKAPGFGDHRKNNIHDIATLTGATVISEDLGLKLEEVNPAWFGSCEKITINKDDTLILNGAGDKNKIEERKNQIRTQIKNPTNSEFEKDKLQERLAKISGGVAVLKIGGISEIEVNEKKDRVTDSLNATRAAVEEGIVAGGGTALTFASKKLNDIIEKENKFDIKVGMQIIQKAIREPLKKIAFNSGVEGAVICEKVLEFKDPQMGYDAYENKFTNMFKSGIIDPAKVVKSALIDAASVAGLMITCEATITDLPKDEPMTPPPNPMGGMGGMGGMGMM